MSYHRPQSYKAGKELTEALSPSGYSPAGLVVAVANALNAQELYGKQSTREGYSVGEHTIIFLKQLDRYFPEGLPGLSVQASRLLGCLHDICKRASNDGREQHAHTIKFLNEKGKKLPVTSEELQIIRSVISRDSIGIFLQSISNSDVKLDEKAELVRRFYDGNAKGEEILAMASRTIIKGEDVCRRALNQAHKDILEQGSQCGMTAIDFLKLMTAYTQVDISCYTSDARRDETCSIPNSELFIDDDDFPIKAFTTPPGRMCRGMEREGAPARCYPSLEGVFAFDECFVTTDFRNSDGKGLLVHTPTRERLVFSSIFEPWYARLEQLASADSSLTIPLVEEGEWHEMDVGDYGESGVLSDKGGWVDTSAIRRFKALTGFDAAVIHPLHLATTSLHQEFRTPRTAFDAVNRLLATVTEVFHYDIAWNELRLFTIPELLQTKKALKIACAGCSTGEECLSIAYLMAAEFPDVPFEVTGIDYNSAALRVANHRKRNPVFWNEAAPELRYSYARLAQSQPEIDVGFLYEKIRFEMKNLLEDQIGEFDLIICGHVRNNYQRAGSNRIFRNLVDALAEDGRLIFSSDDIVYSKPQGSGLR